MAEELLFRLLKLLEWFGVWLSVLAWFTVSGGAAAMAWALRRVGDRRIWGWAAAMFAAALVANLADYFVTLHRSPDLSWEANPLWRNVVDTYGLTVAKWYGFTGKIFVSLLAGEFLAYYLAHRDRLYPECAGSLGEFLRRMGGRARTLGERGLAMFTVFSFFFAGVNLLYFYVAYVNWLEDAETYAYLPPFPLVVLAFVVALAVAFVGLTYRGFRGSTEKVPSRG
jgi:hypothetical protein